MENEFKILVICPLKPETIENAKISFYHRLDLENVTDKAWQEAMEELQPQAIIYGTGFFTRSMLRIWNESNASKFPLYVIRKGSSLTKCDLEAAKEYGINVLNTPGANAPFVANYINQYLAASKEFKRCAILGVGSIGTRVAKFAVQHFKEVVLYNRTRLGSEVLAERGLSSDRLVWAESILEACNGADVVVASIPQTEDTYQSIGADVIQRIASNGKFICVSPFDVLTATAIKALYDREDMTVVFDDVLSEVQEMVERINVHNTREHFILEEKAASSYECGLAMDAAAMNVVERLANEN